MHDVLLSGISGVCSSRHTLSSARSFVAAARQLAMQDLFAVLTMLAAAADAVLVRMHVSCSRVLHNVKAVLGTLPCVRSWMAGEGRWCAARSSCSTQTLTRSADPPHGAEQWVQGQEEGVCPSFGCRQGSCVCQKRNRLSALLADAGRRWPLLAVCNVCRRASDIQACGRWRSCCKPAALRWDSCSRFFHHVTRPCPTARTG